MAFALISNAAAATSDSVLPATTTGIDTTGANLIVIITAHYHETGRGPVTVSDSKGNTWTALTTYVAGDPGCKVQPFYSASPTVGTGHTFTASTAAGATYHVIAVAAFSGAHATPYDTINGASSAGATSLAAGSITPSQDNCLVICGMGYEDSTAASVDSGMSATNTIASTANNEGCGLAYKIQTTAAAINPTWSWTNSVACASAVFSFKAAAGGGGGPQTKRLVNSATIRSLVNAGLVN